MKLEENDQKMVERLLKSKSSWHKAVLNNLFDLAVCGGAHAKWPERFVEFSCNDSWKADEIDNEVIDWVLSSYPAFLVCGWCFFEEYYRRRDEEPSVELPEVNQVKFNKEVDEVLAKINASIKRRN